MSADRSKEVIQNQDLVTKVSRFQVQEFKNMALINPRKRIRYNAHLGMENPIHEMLIVHTKGTYVPPHRHSTKTESFHIIEGELTVFLFDDTGKVYNIIPMGEYASERSFFYRVEKNIWHCLMVESEFIVFHETTNGPFDVKAIEFAPWAPQHEGPESEEFMQNLAAQKGPHFQ